MWSSKRASSSTRHARTPHHCIFRVFRTRVLTRGTRGESKRSRDTDTRPRQWRKKRKKSLFLFRPPRIYVSCVHSRLLSLDRYEAERKAREKREIARGTGNPSDGRTIHTGRGRGQFGPVVGLDRSAKRERREESKRPRERRRSLDDTVTLCAVRASRLGRGWRADERCYLGGAAMVTEQR